MCVYVCTLCVCVPPHKISWSSIEKYLFICLNYFHLLEDLFEMRQVFSIVGKAGLYWEECSNNHCKVLLTLS